MYGSPQPVTLWSQKRAYNPKSPSQYAPRFFELYISQDVSIENVTTSYRDFQLRLNPFFFTLDTQLIMYSIALMNWFNRETDNKKKNEAMALLQGEVPNLVTIDPEVIVN